ncbi:MAG: hypothetical protein ACOWWO_03580 [Peptococcaceae bacterium]
MTGNIKRYLENIAPGLPPEIISPAAYRKIYKLTDLFSDFAASEYILESCLNTEAAEVDFSFRVLQAEKPELTRGFKSPNFSPLSGDGTWLKVSELVRDWSQGIGDVWFEMDYGELAKEVPQPCVFFNAEQIKKGMEVDYDLLLRTLRHLVEHDQLELLKANLQAVIGCLPSQAGLFQVGVMLARHTDRIRIFTADLTRKQIEEYLAGLRWEGSFSGLTGLFQLAEPYSDRRYILDFDVTGAGISEKIGINFGLADQDKLPAFLESLVQGGLCRPVKKRGVLNWSGSKGSFLGADLGFTALIKDISHFKMVYAPAEGVKVKAYLRLAGIYLKKLFKGQTPLEESRSGQKQTVKEYPEYKEMQKVFKKIAQKSMLEDDYRQLCLKDSKAAIRQINNENLAIPENIIFLEEDPENIDKDSVVYILPPFLKQTWLLNNDKGVEK